MNERMTQIENRKAFHDFLVLEKFEAGIALTGCEIKSIRQGKANLRDSFAKVIKGEIWLFNCHISAYEYGNRQNLDPVRDRKLLLHKSEIRKLIGKVERKGFTVIPLAMYFSKNKLKVRLALCQAKKLFDKRHALKEKAQKRDVEHKIKAR